MLSVYDNVLPDPVAYRAAALALDFADVTVGPLTFHGIAMTSADALKDKLPSASLSFFRLSPAGQVEPHYIHDDRDMGAWTAILYLNPEPAAGDGTTFWRPRVAGAEWADVTQWVPWRTVAAKWNRLVWFPATWAHSRALEANYGTSPQDARLIQVVFGGSKWP